MELSGRTIFGKGSSSCRRMCIDICGSSPGRKSSLIAYFLVLLAVGWGPRIASGLEIKTTDGAKYEQATVTRVDGDGLRIAYRFGVAKIPFERLPESLKRQYHFNATAVAAYRKREQEKRKPAVSSGQAYPHVTNPNPVAVPTPLPRQNLSENTSIRSKDEPAVETASSPRKIVQHVKPTLSNSAAPTNSLAPILIGGAVILIVLRLAKGARAPGIPTGYQQSRDQSTARANS